MRKKYVIAMDSYKGCLTSEEAGRAVEAGIKRADRQAEIKIVPATDGGEGMLEAFVAACGGHLVSVAAHDPLMREIRAEYAVCGGQAIVESARSCGLTLLKPGELNPLRATSYGLGEIIAQAVRDGHRRFIVGLGGTATSDAGKGMIEALAERMGVCTDEPDALRRALDECTFLLASDVTNPLLGANGAACVFAPQKGATPEMVRELERRAAGFALRSTQLLGRDEARTPGAGAAGGIGYAFMEYLNAQCRPGADLLLEAAGFGELVRDATAVVTGEGRSDCQTLMGKLPARVKRAADRQAVPTWLVSGQIAAEAADELNREFAWTAAVSDEALPLEVNMKKEVAQRHITHAVALRLSQ